MSAFWLLKTEPDDFSIDDLQAKGGVGEPWDGVRNYQARNFLRQMNPGNLAFIYHSACKEPAIVGLATVISDPYPDRSAIDPASRYFDVKSSVDNIRWSLVDVQFKQKFATPLTLAAIKAEPALASMKLVTSPRLSVSPLTRTEFQLISQRVYGLSADDQP